MRTTLGGIVAALTLAGVAAPLGAAPATAAPVDTTPPTVTVDIAPVDGNDGWHRSRPRVVLTASDRSGIDDATSSLVLTGATHATVGLSGGSAELVVDGEGRTTIAWEVADLEGNVRRGSTSVAVDTVAPAAAVDAERSVVRVGADLPLGAGCSDAVSGLAACSLTGAVVADRLDTSRSGDLVVTATATDRAGHETVTRRTFTVLGPEVVPTVSMTTETPAGETGWFTTAPTVTVLATPGHPGTSVRSTRVAVAGRAPTSVDGDRQQVAVLDQGVVRVAATATDDLGATSVEVVRELRVDSVAPLAWFSSRPTVVEQSSVVPVSVDCHDATSGVARCELVEGATPTGALATDVVGEFVLRGRAVDTAGNTTTVEQAYEVVPASVEEPWASTVTLHLPAGATTRDHVPAVVRLGGGGVRGGAVVISDGGRELGRYDVAPGRTLTAGEATATVLLPRLGTGTHRLVASYLGADGVAPSQGEATVVVRSPASVRAAYRVTGRRVTASVRVTGADARATGQVVLRDGGRVVGTAMLGRDGRVRVTTGRLSRGHHRLTAAYSGSATVLPASSTPATVRV